VTAVLAAALGTTAVAAPPGMGAGELFRPDGSTPGRIASYVAAGERIGDAALRRQLVAGVAHAGASSRALSAAQTLGRQPANVLDDQGEVVVVSSTDGLGGLGGSLETAGDLDGNGVGDVLDIRYAQRKEDKSSDFALHVRDGASGRVLWSRQVSAPGSHFVVPIAANVGSPARPGVVLCDISFTNSGGDTTTVVQALTALRGSDGHVLWRRTDTGRTRSTDTGYSGHAVYVGGLLPGGAGHADELLLVAEDFDVDFDNGRQSGAVTGLVLSGASGAVRTVVPKASSADSQPLLQQVLDVSGDGRDDLGLVIGGASPRVETRRPADGSVVWTQKPAGLTGDAALWSVGAVTASRVRGRVVNDIAISNGAPGGAVLRTPLSDVPLGPQHGQVLLLSGASGARVWAQAGDFPVAVGKAGAPLQPALGVATIDSGNNVNGTTATMRLKAYSASASVLYDVSYSTTAPTSTDPGFGFGFAWPFGDAQPDGSQEVAAWLYAFNGDGESSRDLVLDGATGTSLNRAAPLGPSVTGRGYDFVTVKTGDNVRVTVQRGRDGATLFDRTLQPGRPTSYGYAYSSRLRPGCPDVVVGATGKDDEYGALLSPRGELRWSVLHKRGELRAGPVARPRAAAGSACR
jgi:hypothetical protein